MSARQEPSAQTLPPIPAKRYFTIGEVSELCGVKPHVLRYWEQEFSQLRPMKRRGNRRYYQHHEVLLIRRIRQLLYEEGFTINGARNRLGDGAAGLARQRNGAVSQISAHDSADVGGDEDAVRHDQSDLEAGSALREAVHPTPGAPAQPTLRQESLPLESLPDPLHQDEILRQSIREARSHLEAAARLLSIG
jgi:DNA-binding transcriptional MerR regulator